LLFFSEGTKIKSKILPRIIQLSWTRLGCEEKKHTYLVSLLLPGGEGHHRVLLGEVICKYLHGYHLRHMV
jgi:hypothetical protein